MRPLPLLIVLIVALPAFFTPMAQAWSPLENFEVLADWDRSCEAQPIAEGDSDEADDIEEEEEEPDCE